MPGKYICIYICCLSRIDRQRERARPLGKYTSMRSHSRKWLFNFPPFLSLSALFALFVYSAFILNVSFQALPLFLRGSILSQRTEAAFGVGALFSPRFQSGHFFTAASVRFCNNRSRWISYSSLSPYTSDSIALIASLVHPFEFCEKEPCVVIVPR